jgi:hypothetical protein
VQGRGLANPILLTGTVTASTISRPMIDRLRALNEF